MTQLGRPREFDVDEALERAMGAFWARGYEATSLADLMEATELQKGSIYKAFGDKRSLFLRALERYLERNLETLEADIRRSSTPMEALEAGLKGMVDALCAPRNARRGCFAVNTVVELAPHDQEMARRLRRHFRRQRDLIEPLIERCQAEGVIRSDETARGLADLLIALVPGVVVDSKAGGSVEKEKKTLDLALRVLTP